jgi:hypothetical protein
MSSVQAITSDMILSAKIASFQPISQSAKDEIVNEIFKVMEEQRKKHNFIVYRIAVDTKENKHG